MRVFEADDIFDDLAVAVMTEADDWVTCDTWPNITRIVNGGNRQVLVCTQFLGVPASHLRLLDPRNGYTKIIPKYEIMNAHCAAFSNRTCTLLLMERVKEFELYQLAVRIAQKHQVTRERDWLELLYAVVFSKDIEDSEL